jgi:hypothetical protein
LLVSVPESVEDALPIAALVGVRAEIVALGLNEIGGKSGLAQGVEVVERR